MVAIAVTEPDFGSDVAALRATARRAPRPEGGVGDGWRINGVKTWCTFAARAEVLMLLARTDPDRSKGHRGLSLFIVTKERGAGHGFELTQPEGGKMEGRPIDTIGYRGMHSYEVALDNWYVPGDCLIGGDAGQGRGSCCRCRGSRTAACRPQLAPWA
jgi:(2S)-methylsuccinyl-CoA dehydrogenase